jgi:hypothetical protein
MSTLCIVQHELYDLLPGSAGGRAIRESRGASHFSALGASGGLQTFRRFGTAHMRELGRRGALEARRRRNLPRTIRYLDGGDLVESRIVPWWPHQPRRRRRKRPVLVEIEVSRLAVEL